MSVPDVRALLSLPLPNYCHWTLLSCSGSYAARIFLNDWCNQQFSSLSTGWISKRGKNGFFKGILHSIMSGYFVELKEISATASREKVIVYSLSLSLLLCRSLASREEKAKAQQVWSSQLGEVNRVYRSTVRDCHKFVRATITSR